MDRLQEIQEASLVSDETIEWLVAYAKGQHELIKAQANALGAFQGMMESGGSKGRPMDLLSNRDWKWLLDHVEKVKQTETSLKEIEET